MKNLIKDFQQEIKVKVQARNESPPQNEEQTEEISEHSENNREDSPVDEQRVLHAVSRAARGLNTFLSGSKNRVSASPKRKRDEVTDYDDAVKGAGIQ